jgi:Rps23 Pro-64 3,4-dihydroxylase Tpa1-like proline 4-hydroxylase
MKGNAVEPLEPKVGRGLISGRELFICDNFIARPAAIDIANYIDTLNYRRSEKSRPDTPISGGSCDIPDAVIFTPDGFFERIKEIASDLFPGEPLRKLRAYVNNTVYGDMYYTHRDCHEDHKDVTILYYANLDWDREWGGETIYFTDDYDAQAVVSPRPGRLVIARGAILHRGGVPTRSCYQERRTIAYKLAVD